MILDLQPPKIEQLFQINVRVTMSAYKTMDYTCKRYNDEIIAIRLYRFFYLVQKPDIFLLNIQSDLCSFDLSGDHKYLAICFFKKTFQLLLYDMKEKNIHFEKQIVLSQKRVDKVKLSILSNLIIIVSINAIDCFNFSGQKLYEKQIDQNENCFQLKLNEKFLFFQESFQILEIAASKLCLLYAKSQKVLKQFCIFRDYLSVWTISDNLLLQNSNHKEKIMKFRELWQQKLLRMYLGDFKIYYSKQICQKLLLRNEIVILQEYDYFKINIARGNIHLYSHKFPFYVNSNICGCLEDSVQVKFDIDKFLYKDEEMKLKLFKINI